MKTTRIPVWKLSRKEPRLSQWLLLIERVWIHPTTGWCLLAVLLVACVVLWGRPQPAGYAATVGTVVAVMTLREMKHIQKVMLAVAILILIRIELRDIGLDREKSQAEFRAIAKSLNNSIDLVKETIRQVTGGDTYPTISAFGHRLAIVANGTHALKSVYISVMSHTPAIQSGKLGIRENTATTFLPTVFVGPMMELPDIEIDPRGNTDEFHIQVLAANGVWNEIITAKKQDGHWIYDSKVTDGADRVLKDFVQKPR